VSEKNQYLYFEVLQGMRQWEGRCVHTVKERHDTSSQVDQITNEGKEKELKVFLSVRVETVTII
jgi:hypothetical protein